MNKNDLKTIKAFHGHIGPYVVLGFRAGKLARRLLKKINGAKIFTNIRPPDSCFIDGIQLSTGCTIGRGRLKLIKRPSFEKAVFFNKNKKLIFKITPNIYPITLLKVKKLKNSKLFSITNH
jgi:formylmethanofuran dehydrogenase subunit E